MKQDIKLLNESVNCFDGNLKGFIKTLQELQDQYKDHDLQLRFDVNEHTWNDCHCSADLIIYRTETDTEEMARLEAERIARERSQAIKEKQDQERAYKRYLKLKAQFEGKA